MYLTKPRNRGLKPFDLEIAVRITCDVGYHSADFSIRRPSILHLGSRYVTDKRQTSDTQTDSIIA